jgi:hypothetical protein
MPLLTPARAPSYAQLRPLKPPTTQTFPVYPDLPELLATEEKHPDDRIRHVLATAAGYAYSDGQTVAMIMARMGLEENRCLTIAQAVDAMFIRSTAFLIQSRCGRVVILCYRGTEPTSVINWLTDVEVTPEKVTFFPDGDASKVHAGFYRNVRATRYEVIAALERALRGESVLGDGEKVGKPLEALYLTGHSLGAAMAAMMAVMLGAEEAYAPLLSRLRGVYTYGQPMIGNGAFARRVQSGDFPVQAVFRYRYAYDVVPELPPRAAGEFQHFGSEFRYERKHGGDGAWRATPATGQLSSLLEIPGAAAAFFAHQFELLRNMPFQHSMEDHAPQHYISALTPPGVRSEFGD